MASNKFVVGPADQLADGERMFVTIQRRSIGIFNVRGRYYGLLNRCPHKGAEVCKGTVVGNLEAAVPGEYTYDAERKFLVCPWHGWEFDMETGQSYFDPRRVRTRRYDVAVEDGATVLTDIDSGLTEVTPDQFAAQHQAAGTDVADSARLPGPYRAETYEITVENDYLVLTFRPARTTT